MKTALTYILAFLSTLNPAFASITLSVVSALAVFTWLNAQWVAMIAKVDAMAAASFAGTLDFQPMALCNVLIPLTEILSYLSAWLGVLFICTIIRIIKSFIPAIAT